MSAFLDLTTLVADALLQSPALAGGRVKRGRSVPVGDEADSAITVNVVRSRAAQLDVEGTALQWETIVAVTLYARCAAGVDAEDTIDPLLVATWSRLLGITTPAHVFGIALEPDIQWDVDEADATVVSASLSLRITHITTGAALAAA